MEFRVLGPLEVVDNGRELVPTAPKLRAVLAFLVLQQGRGVHTHELIDELWGENPPVSALQTLQTYVYQLRKILGERDAEGVLLQTRPYGYALAIPAGSLDLSRFERLAEEGRVALGNQDAENATRLLSQALGLWRGPALANVAAGQVLSAQVTRLEEIQLRALEMRVDADLMLGRHQSLVSELKALILAQPLHEGLHAKLMVALHRSGRRYEALDVYQRLRGFLIKELGLEPSPDLRRLHQALLTSDPSLDPLAPPQVAVVAAPQAGARAVPLAQLPPDIPDFSGRAAQVRLLEHLLVPERERGTATPIVNITGPPGSGKTVLAVHVAHRLKGQFPGGQLIARLHGKGTAQADPLAVLGEFLHAAGIPAAQVPPDLAQRSNLFRSWCADRDVLIVLDDAASWQQITPLIPGNRHCAVIVTSRGHAMAGTQALALGLMDEMEGLELLTNVIGCHRVAAERAAAEDIISLCGGLPVAIRAAAARLAASTSWPLSKLARRLADPRSRLDELRFGDLDARAGYDTSYQGLGSTEKSVFRLLGSLQIPWFTALRAGELLGCDSEAAETLLDRLVDSHLLAVMGQDEDGALIYAFPELIRIYARERLEQVIGSEYLGTPTGPQRAQVIQDRYLRAGAGVPVLPVHDLPGGQPHAGRSIPPVTPAWSP